MLTKEELLQKGVPEEAADEIISAFSEGNNDQDPIDALQKALVDDPDMDHLIKADKEGDMDKKDNEDEYDESYMKKYMKRYMKENKASVQKMMKNLGAASENMNKAISDIDSDSDCAVVEATDLAPYLESQTKFNGELVKAMSDFNDRVDIVSAKVEKAYDVLQKASKVIVEQSKGLNSFLSTPQGRKGSISADMKKAAQVDIKQISKEDNAFIYKTLMKATRNGDEKAGVIVSAFESMGHDAKKLNTAQKQYLQELLKKEVS